MFGLQHLSALLALAAHDELRDGKQASGAPDLVQGVRLAVTAALMSLISGTGRNFNELDMFETTDGAACVTHS